MVKLDVSLLRFLDDEDFRVLTALEMAMRNHDVAPTAIVERIAQLPHGGCRKRLQGLLKHKMIHHENTMYDGYAMKYAAYDYLALRTLNKRGTIAAVGHRIGCGKESDIILVQDEAGRECVLKLQRLGRCSFRTVSRNRDYKGGGRSRRGESWFYLSRLAAQKEYSFMRALYDEGFPVPRPIDSNRHALLMELVDGTLLNNISVLGDAAKVYKRCLDLIIKLAEHGLVHGDFNEFNLMITENMHVVVIDFPQMVSTNHPNASELFSRDVKNLANFFHRRFRVTTLFYPTLEKDVVRTADLDRAIFASGCFSSKCQQDFERLLKAQHIYNADYDVDCEGEEDEEEKDGNKSLLSTSSSFLEAAQVGDGSANSAVQPLEATVIDSTKKEKKSDEYDEDEEHQQKQQNYQKSEKERVVTNNSVTNDKRYCLSEEGEKDDTDKTSDDSLCSFDEAIKKAAFERQRQQNVNFRPDGTIDEAYVRSQVRRNIRGSENHKFNCGLHRNIQKGRQKQKIQRQIKKGMCNGIFD